MYLVGDMERQIAASICRRQEATLVALQYEVVVHEQLLLRIRHVNGGRVYEIYADMFWEMLQLRFAVMEHLGLHPVVVELSFAEDDGCLLYTSPSPRDRQKSRMPSSA